MPRTIRCVNGIVRWSNLGSEFDIILSSEVELNFTENIDLIKYLL